MFSFLKQIDVREALVFGLVAVLILLGSNRLFDEPRPDIDAYIISAGIVFALLVGKCCARPWKN